jgi:hypothetical protein
MPKLQDAKELTAPLEELVRELKSELNDGRGDFDKLVRISDDLGAQADALAETFGTINQTLMARIDDLRTNAHQASRRKSASRS